MASTTAVATTELEPSVSRQPSIPEPEDPHMVCYHLALMAAIADLVSVTERPEFNSTASIHRIWTEYLGELLIASILSFY